MTDDRAAVLRHRLADELQRSGALRSPHWRQAVERIPRHEFLPEFFESIETPHGTHWEPVTRAGLPDRWLDLAYQNKTWVTQLDKTITPHQVTGPTPGDPTSSSTLPSLVVEMLEELDLADGMKVLEIGTGTGYSTALMCERLGDEQVTSIEYDPGVAANARTALARVGHTPHLAMGDGLSGVPAQAPYDRIIATCSVRHIPASWLAQARPGAQILVTIAGWLHGFGLARLEVTDDGTAEGRFLPGTISFMIARSQAPPTDAARQAELLAALADAPARAAQVGGDLHRDWTGVFVAQLAAPGAQWQARRVDGGPWVDYYYDLATGSGAALTPETDGGWSVQQTGPVHIWDDIEDAIAAWKAAGSPAIDQFHIHTNGRTQTVSLDTTAWTLTTDAP
ncbi:ATP-grasp peptide maturase system methyltransferase [Spirillospora sp. NBC_00431]